jgi:hypothetical protein
MTTAIENQYQFTAEVKSKGKQQNRDGWAMVHRSRWGDSSIGGSPSTAEAQTDSFGAQDWIARPAAAPSGSVGSVSKPRR